MMRGVTLVFWGLLVLACGGEPGGGVPGEGPATTRQEIFNGTENVPSPYGHVFFANQWGGFWCSGTLLTNRWVMGATHCFRDGNGNSVSPSDLEVWLEGSGGPWVSDVQMLYFHPTRDITMAYLTSPLPFGGSYTAHLNSTYNNTDSQLVNKTLKCWGYGANAWVPDPSKLRYAALPVSGQENGWIYTAPNAQNQQLFSGDSGTCCFYVDSSSVAHLAGVLSWGIWGEEGQPDPLDALDSAFGSRAWISQITTGPNFDSLLGGTTWVKPASMAYTESSGNKYVELFVTGTDSHIYGQYALVNYDGSLGPWSGYYFASEGGTARGPSVVPFGTGAFLFVTDDKLWVRRRLSDYSFQAWVDLGKPSSDVSSAPAAVVVNQEIWVFVRDGLGQLKYKKRASNGTWGGWQSSLGTATFTHDPAAVFLNNKVWVFARSTGGNISFRSFNLATQTWSGWSGLGNSVTSGPTAVARGTQRIDVFVKSSDNRLHSQTYYGGMWSGWIEQSTTTLLNAAPGASGRGDGIADIFVVRMDGVVERKQTPW